jgi:hypothetical protein
MCEGGLKLQNFISFCRTGTCRLEDDRWASEPQRRPGGMRWRVFGVWVMLAAQGAAATSPGAAANSGGRRKRSFQRNKKKGQK